MTLTQHLNGQKAVEGLFYLLSVVLADFNASGMCDTILNVKAKKHLLFLATWEQRNKLKPPSCHYHLDVMLFGGCIRACLMKSWCSFFVNVIQ